MRKLSYLTLLAGLFFVGLMIGLGDVSPDGVALSMPNLEAELTADSTSTQPQKYLVVFETRPNGTSLDAQIADMTAFLAPELFAFQQQGQLKSFSLVPELGAILLEMPNDGVLTQVSAWAGVRTVVPATAQQSQRVIGQLDIVRQENIQVQQAAQVAAELEAVTQRPPLNTASLSQPAVVNVTFNVLSTTDAVDANPGDGVCETALGNGICTLRAAVQETNALPGADVINLAAGTYGFFLSGSLEDAAATGDLDITDDLTINGDPLGATAVNGGGSYIGDRVFHIIAGTVTINHLDIRAGYADPVYSELGGGILVNAGATLNLNYSVVMDNFAVFGGSGILTNGDLSVFNSTISSNNSSDGSGGGIKVQNGTTSLDSVTITSNSAYYAGGVSGNFNARNSIIAGNWDIGFTPDCGGTLTSQGYNLIQDVTGCTITGNTTGNITGLSPVLGFLLDNGGPTATHALLSGSPAIDAGDSSNCPATDQRGVSRPADGNGDSTAVCDIGAYEYVFAPEITSLTVDVNETYLYGYVSESNVPITLTLKSGTIVKSRVNTVADGTYFNAYFTDVIEGGDTIEIDFPDVPAELIAVPPLTLDIDKATDVVSGTGLANEQVSIRVYSYADRYNYYEYPMADGSGNYSADFSGQTDIFLGDEVDLWVYDANSYQFRINNFRVRGLTVDPVYNTASGYADPGADVNLTLKNSGGVVKTTAVDPADSDGWFWVSLPGAVDIVPGDSMEMQYGSQPVQTVQIVAGTVDSIDPATDAVTGTGLANSKMEVYTFDNYTTNYATIVTHSDSVGQYAVDFSGIVDILLGSYAYVTYHDAQDNEVRVGNLYAGPYVRAAISSWTDLYVVGQPNEAIDATLRNGLGAVKATASGMAGLDGYAYLDFLDSTGSSVDILAGDQVEVSYGSGLTRIVDAVGIDFVADRDTRTVTGIGPANSNLRLIYDYWTEADATTDANGHFSHTFSWLTGGYSMEILYRNPQGNDVEVYGYVPQFTIDSDSGYVNGYGPFNVAVVASLKDSGGVTKESVAVTTDHRGSYWLDFTTDIVVNDRVVIDVGPLHYDQTIVPLSITADTANNIVYGTAPPNAWLNVFDENYFGPYDYYNYKYFYADTSGNFSASFGEVLGGDYLRVLYWENGQEDRVQLHRYAPYVHINHTTDSVYGTTSSGAVGTVTVRSSGGAVKASGTVTGSVPYGSFTFLPDVDILPGDQIETNVGVLNQTDSVIPMSGSLNLGTDTVSGTSLPSINLGLEVYHWLGTNYSSYTDNGSMSGFAPTDGGGAYSINYGAVADLTTGDNMRLFYYDGDTRYQASFYTTNPTVTLDSYPTAVQPNTPVEIQFTLADGAHATSIYARWDTQSHDADNSYAYYTSWQQGVIGQNLVSFNAPAGGTIYFKVLAYVDGRPLWSDEHTISISGSDTTTLFDPVSGTTNDSTPQISGITVPNADVTLYQDGVVVMMGTADANGNFTFDITTPLAPGTYNFHAVSTSGGSTGPDSNTVRLTVDPSLYVDPVHILLITRGQTQHLRDASGYANLGGQVWTRTGDSVAVSIPISYTNIYTADLYVGAIYETSLLDSGSDVYVGTYTPPSSGNYAVSLKFRGDGAAGPVYTVDILTGLIDPDGYVYDADHGLDYRVAGTTVTCQELTDESNNIWGTWNASVWDQINPQTTAADGYYAFFTLPGKYKVTVSAPGYWDYESPVLTVVNAPVHHNVPLVPIKTVYLPVVIR